MNAPMKTKPTPEQVESMQRKALDLLEAIIECRLEQVVGPDFMRILRQLVINPVREELR